MYTDVRWTVETEVQPGAQVVASFEARLTTGDTATPAGSSN